MQISGQECVTLLKHSQPEDAGGSSWGLLCCCAASLPKTQPSPSEGEGRGAVLLLWRRGGRSERIYGASTRACMVH